MGRFVLVALVLLPLAARAQDELVEVGRHSLSARAPFVDLPSGATRVVLTGTLSDLVDGAELDARSRSIGGTVDVAAPAVLLPAGVTVVASDPELHRYELEIDPTVWFLEDEGHDLAVFHSHPETEPIPSRTDRELAGLWSGKPFLIYGLAHDDLRAWRVSRDQVDEIQLRTV